MELINIYANLIRIALIVITIYKVYKKEFKLILPAVIVFALTFLISLLDIIFEVEIDTVGSAIYYTNIFMSIYLGSGFKF